MKTFNVVIYWSNQVQLIVEPTSLKCDNLIPLRAFTSGEYEVRMYTSNEEQVFVLKHFPLENMASYLIQETYRRELASRKRRVKR